MKRKQFILSSGGKLAVLISMILTPAAITYAAGIQAAGEGANRPEISHMNNGAVLINIAPPSESGVSHNHYQEFNVDKPGAVFNNSIQNTNYDRESIAANPNLATGGRGATVILNEVVGDNRSVLLGRQHLVGAGADYVLANPNGITCDGCSFDPNFNKVTLGVGGVLDFNGEYKGGYHGIYTAYRTGKLVVKNTTLSEDIANSLHLITPTIQVDSDLSAMQDINIVLGMNDVDINSNVTMKQYPNSTENGVDAILLGGIAANRIKIFDNQNHRKMIILENISARSTLDINVAGPLDITATNLIAHNALNIKALAVNMESADKRLGFEQMQLSSSKINIIADNEVNLTNVTARDVGGKLFVKGGEVTINSTNSNIANKLKDYDDTAFLAKRRGHETETTTYLREVLLLGEDISLEASSGDLTLNGVNLTASKELSLKAAQDIKMSGVETAKIHEKWIQYTAYGPDLKDGNDNAYTKRSGLRNTRLSSMGNINISSGRDIFLAGASVNTIKNLSIAAAKNIDINVQKTENKDRISKKYTQASGLAGSEMDYTTETYDVNHKSNVYGNIVNIKAQGDVAITASEISSMSQGNISGNNVIFSGVLNEKYLNSNKSTGGVLNVITDESKKNNSYERFIDSKVFSAGDFNLKGNRVVIDGSLFDIAESLNIHSKTGVSITAARQQQKIDEENTRFSLDFYTKKESKEQYQAGFMLKHSKETEVSLENERNIATITAGNISIHSESDNMEFYGTALTATKNNIILKSLNDIGFFAARNTAVTDKTKTVSSGGAYYTGGVNKAGNGVTFNHDNEKSHLATDTGIVSRLNSAGNISISAGGDITQQGSQHVAGGEYSAKGENINQLASNNSSIGRTTEKHASGGVGFNINYSGIIRPFRKALENDIAKNGVVIPNLKNTNVGVDIDGKGHKLKKSAESVVAFVTSIHAGGEIKLLGNNTIIDEGTQYQSGQSINIIAKDYFNKSAVNSSKGDEKKESAEGGVRVATTTGNDIKISLKGEGKVNESDFYTKTLLPSVLKSGSGVNISIANDAYLQAPQIEGGQGDVVITAGNKIHLDHSTSTRDKNSSEVYGKGGLKIGITSSSTGVDAEGAGHKQQKTHFYNNAIKSNITTLANVKLSARDGDLILIGTQVGKGDAPVNNVELNAGGKVRLLASVSDSATREDKTGGSLVLGISKSGSADNSTTGGAVGFGAKKMRINESTLFSQGAAIYSRGEVAIRAKSDDNEAIYAQGLQVNATGIDINAVYGGVLLESAQSQSSKDNIDFFISASVSGSKTSGSNADSHTEYKPTGGSFNINNDKDKQWVIKHENNRIIGRRVLLASAKDIQLKGARIEADKAQLDVGGNLKIQSVKELEEIDKNDVRFNLSYMGSTDLVGDEMIEFGGSVNSTNTNKQGITEISGIFGQKDVVINHKGKKILANAEVVNTSKPVDWNTFTVNPLKPNVVVKEKKPAPVLKQKHPNSTEMLALNKFAIR